MELKFVLGIVFFVIVIIGFFIYQGDKIDVTEYDIKSDKIINPIRITFLSDLHEKRYINNSLRRVVWETKPDLILVGGDMINRRSGNAEPFADLELPEPVYCVLGNHEVGYIKEHDVIKYPHTILNNESVELNINGNKISVFGITHMRIDQYIYKYNYWKTDGYRILLAHKPVVAEIYKNQDLVLCGHTHGGQWRIFGKGVFVPGEGLFPKLTAGLKNVDGALTIISRGLGDHTHIPRLNNHHELVVINLLPENTER